MGTLEILIEARRLIESPDNWTIQEFARDRNGHIAPVASEAAVCFCALGAIARAAKIEAGAACRSPAAEALLSAIGTSKRVGAVSDFNDTRSHPEVLALFDRAIKAAEHVGARS
jgi:Asp-tRNA(Asn)/Glu-tRNA(Gln) amidotransferase A subunit family amidase